LALSCFSRRRNVRFRVFDRLAHFCAWRFSSAICRRVQATPWCPRTQPVDPTPKRQSFATPPFTMVAPRGQAGRIRTFDLGRRNGRGSFRFRHTTDNARAGQSCLRGPLAAVHGIQRVDRHGVSARNIDVASRSNRGINVARISSSFWRRMAGRNHIRYAAFDTFCITHSKMGHHPWRDTVLARPVIRAPPIALVYSFSAVDTRLLGSCASDTQRTSTSGTSKARSPARRPLIEQHLIHHQSGRERPQRGEG